MHRFTFWHCTVGKFWHLILFVNEAVCICNLKWESTSCLVKLFSDRLPEKMILKMPKCVSASGHIVLAFSFRTSFHLWRIECCLLLRMFCHVIMNVLQMFCFLKYSVCLNHFLFYMRSLKPFINLFGYTGTLKCLSIKSLHKFVTLHNFTEKKILQRIRELLSGSMKLKY